MRKISATGRRRIAVYMPAQREYLRAHPDCEICLARGLQPNPATEVHHTRGRNGRLIADTRFFKASCFSCRMWPHDNPREARRLGVLAEATDWGVSLR